MEVTDIILYIKAGTFVKYFIPNLIYIIKKKYQAKKLRKGLAFSFSTDLFVPNTRSCYFQNLSNIFFIL